MNVWSALPCKKAVRQSFVSKYTSSHNDPYVIAQLCGWSLTLAWWWMSGPYLFCKSSQSTHKSADIHIYSQGVSVENTCSRSDHYGLICFMLGLWCEHGGHCNMQTLTVFHCIHLCVLFLSSFHASDNIISIHSCAVFISFIYSITFLSSIHLSCTIHLQFICMC